MEAFLFLILFWFLKQVYRKKEEAEFVIPIFTVNPLGNVVEEMSR